MSSLPAELSAECDMHRSSDSPREEHQTPCPLMTQMHLFRWHPYLPFHSTSPVHACTMVLLLSGCLHHPSRYLGVVLSISFLSFTQKHLSELSMARHRCHHPSCPCCPRFFWISAVNFQLTYRHSLCPPSSLFSTLKLDCCSLCSKNPMAAIARGLKIKLLTLLTMSCQPDLLSQWWLKWPACGSWASLLPFLPVDSCLCSSLLISTS